MPTLTEAFALAIRHHQSGRLEAAEQLYRHILQLDPTHADSWHMLGVIYAQTGNQPIAVEYIARALAERPDWAEAQVNLGNVLREQGKPDEAVRWLRSALRLKPGHLEALNNLGNALKDRGDLDEAIACYRRALELKPDYAKAHYNLGMALRELGELVEAVACYRRALELRPDDADTQNNLGNALKDLGDLDEAIACYRRALELKPDYARAHSNLLYTLHYCPGVTSPSLAEAHTEYDRRHAAHLYLAATHPVKIRRPHDRPRLGFVSPDLGRHPVGHFLVRVLENLGRERLETICYSDRVVKDDLTHRLQAAVTGWRDVMGLSHERLAERIRADGIDILFDLAGHTAHNRLLAFARKPAPIQISWIGYEGTTGLSAMDYLLADRLMVPEGSERYYRERVLRMPDGYLCYEPPESAPAVGPPPCLEAGYATFGSFNNPAKITREVVAVWARILHGAPTARLIMKYRGLGDESVRKRYLDLFAAQGVPAERVELLPWSSYSDYLSRYQRVDVSLDPFPFSGSTITCESLWMGVPVVTCPGETFASRHSQGHLSGVGLTETIARDLEEYVDLAVSLAGDDCRLSELRAELRGRMAASPLCDGERFAANLASMMRAVWEQRNG
ncbi:MAG: tetratricopeptide repeat protein [Isosphaeraceae bacterium]